MFEHSKFQVPCSNQRSNDETTQADVDEQIETADLFCPSVYLYVETVSRSISASIREQLSLERNFGRGMHGPLSKADPRGPDLSRFDVLSQATTARYDGAVFNDTERTARSRDFSVNVSTANVRVFGVEFTHDRVPTLTRVVQRGSKRRRWEVYQ